MKLTTARYFTPNGRSIQAEGIVPDITLENVRLTKGEERTMIKEADLARHLVNPGENGNGQDNGKSDKKAAADKDGEDATDYALTEALNLLKGLVILRPDGSA